jgi:hypothetical protein
MKYELFYLIKYNGQIINNIAMPGCGMMNKAEQYFKDHKDCYVHYVRTIDTFDMPYRKVKQLKLGES